MPFLAHSLEATRRHDSTSVFLVNAIDADPLDLLKRKINISLIFRDSTISFVAFLNGCDSLSKAEGLFQQISANLIVSSFLFFLFSPLDVLLLSALSGVRYRDQ